MTLPNQLGALPDAVAAVLAEFADTLAPGDVIMVNDPFAGGMHLPDIFIVKPVFTDGRLIAIVATVAHHADLGGSVPGSMSPYAEECFQEGLRIPPIRLYRGGTPEHGVFALLRANTRVPDIVLGDVAAQLVALDTGETGLLRLIEHHGEAVFAGPGRGAPRLHRGAHPPGDPDLPRGHVHRSSTSSMTTASIPARSTSRSRSPSGTVR